MKKILLLSAGLLAGAASFAQLSRGRVLLGGTVGFSNSQDSYFSGSSENTANARSLMLSPFGGLFVRDNLLAGVSLLYGHNRFEVNAPQEQLANSHTVGGGLLLRRYFPLGKGFYFYVNGGLSFSGARVTTTGNGNAGTQKLAGVGAVVYPGLSYAFGKRVLLETSLTNFLSLGYLRQKAYDESGALVFTASDFSGGFSAGGSLPLHIGFNILLGK